MNKIPEEVLKAWNEKQKAVVFSTVSDQNIPNSIYVTCISLFENSKILIANNYFDKTYKNIISGSKGTILFITQSDKSYQIKGSLKHETKGKAFDDMKKWNPAHLPGHGVAILEVEEIFSGALKII